MFYYHLSFFSFAFLTSTLILTFFNPTYLFRVGQCQNIADCSLNGGKVGGVCSEAQVIHVNRHHLLFLHGFQTRPCTYGVLCQYYFNLYQNSTKGDIADILSYTMLNFNNSMFLKNKSARPFSSETEIDNQLTVFTFFPFLRNFHYDFHSEKHRSKKFFVIKRLKTEIFQSLKYIL